MRQQRLSRHFEKFRSHGSTRDLALLFDELAPAMLHVARRVSRNAADAEDALQSTFLAAIEHARAWDATRPVEPWLFGILVRQLALARRRDARVVDSARLAPASPEDPAANALRSELATSVEEALRHLSERDREVLLPWLRGDARGFELAERLGVGGSTLRMRLRRGLARLRRALPAGLGAGIVLTAAERSALAAMRSVVLATAVRPGVAAIASAAIAPKLAVAALAIVLAAGGVALVRERQVRTRRVLEAVPSAAADAPATGVAPAEIAVVRAREPAAGESPDESGAIGRDPSGEAGVITSTETRVALTKAAPDAFEGLEGVVVGADGAPIPGAAVHVFDDDARSGGEIAHATSGADGRFRIPFTGVFALHAVAVKEGFGRAVQQGTPFGHPFTITLTEGAPIRGTITRDDGTRGEGILVPFAAVALADDAARYLGPLDASADTSGQYVVEHVAGAVRWIRATSPDSALVGCSAADPAARGSSAESDLVLHAPARLALTIASKEDGRAIAGALVVVQAGSLGALPPFGAIARTDSSGRLLLDRVPAVAPVRVAVAAHGFAPQSRELVGVVSGAERPETFELERGGAVEGVARELDGTPIAGAAVTLDRSDWSGRPRLRLDRADDLGDLVLDDGAPSPFSFSTTTGDDGAFRLEDLPADADRCLRLDAKRRVAFASLARIEPGGIERGIVITLGATVRIEGTLTAEDGPVPPGTQVWLHPASELAKIDAEGRFTLEWKPRGGATLWVAAPGYLHAKCEFAAPLPDVSHVAIELRRGLAVEGSVSDGDRRPVAGAKVIAWPADPTEEERARTGGWITEISLASTTSRADGTFALRGLPDRKVRLVVKAASFDETAVEAVEPGRRDLQVTLTPAR